MWLGSGVAVAVVCADSCSSIRPLAWELPYAVNAALKRKRRKGRKEKNREKKTKNNNKARPTVAILKIYYKATIAKSLILPFNGVKRSSGEIAGRVMDCEREPTAGGTGVYQLSFLVETHTQAGTGGSVMECAPAGGLCHPTTLH